jgi:hypothetical protein
MNKALVTIVSILAGLGIGLYIGFAGEFSSRGWILIVLNGAAFGYIFGIVLFSREYGAIIWSFVVLLIALFIDWFAGSTVNMSNKLAFATAGLLIGWNIWPFRKWVFLGGIILGIVSFIWGLDHAHQFGYIQLEPGILNALLFSIQGCIAGMVAGRLCANLLS